MRKHCSIPFIFMMAICAERRLPKITAISGVATVTPMTHKCLYSQWELMKLARTCPNHSLTSIGTFLTRMEMAMWMFPADSMTLATM